MSWRPDRSKSERRCSKTKQNPKSGQIKISEGALASVAKWTDDPLMVGSEYLWPERFHERLHISTRQNACFVRDGVYQSG